MVLKALKQLFRKPEELQQKARKKITREDIERENKEFKKKSKRPKNLELSKNLRYYIFLTKALDKASADLTRKIDDVVREGKIPIIILPDTSMRNSSYFFTAFLNSCYPELYSGFKTRYGIDPVMHALSFRYSNYTEIPGILKIMKNVMPIIIDYPASGPIAKNSTMYKLKSKLLNEFRLDSLNLAVDENLFNLVSYNPNLKSRYRNVSDNISPRGKINSSWLTGRGGMLKSDFSNPKYKRATYKDYQDSGRAKDWFLEQDLRKLLFQLGISLGRKHRTQRLTSK